MSNTTAKKTSKAQEARRQIMQAAAEMIRERGYADTSLRDVAAEVGMKAGSLYYHFSSKEELAIEVMLLGVQVVNDAVLETLRQSPNADPRQRLKIAMRTHIKTLLSEGAFTSAHIRCMPFAPENVKDALGPMRRSYTVIWRDLVRDYLGDDASDAKILYIANGLVGALNGALEWFIDERDDEDDFVDALADLLLPAQTG